MGNIESPKKQRDLNETLQENADNIRLLKIGLRNHDPETLDAAITRISDKYGQEITESVVITTINILMKTEDWSFELENGEPSPLM